MYILYNAQCLAPEVWNDDVKMNLYCNTSDRKLWATKILSISDEAFLLLFLINYTKRWIAEITREVKKIRVTSLHTCTRSSQFETNTNSHYPNLTTKNMASWTEEDELATMVVSRVLYFNCLSVSRPTNLSSFPKTTPYTNSRTKGHDKQESV